MTATDKIMDEVRALVVLDVTPESLGRLAALRYTVARTIGDLERARDAALEERNRLGTELAGARARLAMSQEQALSAMAEADDLRAEVERWRDNIGAVMPADLKCWHQNSPTEWPEVAAHTIRRLREDRDSWLEQADA